MLGLPHGEGSGFDFRWSCFDQFRCPSVSKGVIISALPTTRVVCKGLGGEGHPNHREMRLIEFHASVERLLGITATLGWWMNACTHGQRDGQLVPAHCHLQVIGTAAWGVVFRELSEPRRKVCWD